MIYGYVRISTKKQNIERQIRNIKELFPEAIIIQEEYTGTSFKRTEWKKLYKNLKPNDTIIFDSVSRMSRDATEGFEIYEQLYNNGISLVFLKEPHIDTQAYKEALDGVLSVNIDSGDNATNELVNGIMTAINKFMMNKAKEDIKKAFEQAEKEVKDLQQRTKEGIETARLNGKQIGNIKGTKLVTKKSVRIKEEIKKHSADFNGTLNDIDVMKLCGVARNTYYKYKREIKAEI